MTVLGVIAYSCLGLVGLGIILMSLSVPKGGWDEVYRPRQDMYWASFVWPILIIGGFAGALLTGLVGALLSLLVPGFAPECISLCE